MQAKLIAGLIGLALVLGLAAYVQTLRGNVKELQGSVKLWEGAYTQAAQAAIDNKKALDDEAKERDRVEGILEARERDNAAKQRHINVLLSEMEKLKNEDPEVRDWARVRVPDAVRLRLEQAPADAHPN